MRRILILSLVLFGFVSVRPATAIEQDALEHFAQHDETSNRIFDFGLWTRVLGSTVINTQGELGQNYSFGQYMKKAGGTRIRMANYGMDKSVGNRVGFSVFQHEFKLFIQAYQADIQEVATREDLATFNRNEQLAYWLNLYNATVYRQIMDRYPLRSLKDQRTAPDGFWAEKSIRIDGYTLSLLDIEEVLFTQWNDPLILYGLWQGAVGGPDLPRRAFTGGNVYAELRNNAREFALSTRNYNNNGRTFDVSYLYRIGARLFPNFDRDVLRHIKVWAPDDQVAYLDGARMGDSDFFRWRIADAFGGARYIAIGGGSDLNVPNTMAFVNA